MQTRHSKRLQQKQKESKSKNSKDEEDFDDAKPVTRSQSRGNKSKRIAKSADDDDDNELVIAEDDTEEEQNEDNDTTTESKSNKNDEDEQDVNEETIDNDEELQVVSRIRTRAKKPQAKAKLSASEDETAASPSKTAATAPTNDSPKKGVIDESEGAATLMEFARIIASPTPASAQNSTTPSTNSSNSPLPGAEDSQDNNNMQDDDYEDPEDDLSDYSESEEGKSKNKRKKRKTAPRGAKKKPAASGASAGEKPSKRNRTAANGVTPEKKSRKKSKPNDPKAGKRKEQNLSELALQHALDFKSNSSQRSQHAYAEFREDYVIPNGPFVKEVLDNQFLSKRIVDTPPVPLKSLDNAFLKSLDSFKQHLNGETPASIRLTNLPPPPPSSLFQDLPKERPSHQHQAPKIHKSSSSRNIKRCTMHVQIAYFIHGSKRQDEDPTTVARMFKEKTAAPSSAPAAQASAPPPSKAQWSSQPHPMQMEDPSKRMDKPASRAPPHHPTIPPRGMVHPGAPSYRPPPPGYPPHPKGPYPVPPGTTYNNPEKLTQYMASQPPARIYPQQPPQVRPAMGHVVQSGMQKVAPQGSKPGGYPVHAMPNMHSAVPPQYHPSMHGAPPSYVMQGGRGQMSTPWMMPSHKQMPPHGMPPQGVPRNAHPSMQPMQGAQMRGPHPGMPPQDKKLAPQQARPSMGPVMAPKPAMQVKIPPQQ